MPTPNFIKYSTTLDNKSIKAGNYAIGVASGTTYGPTSSTSYWSGISPTAGGYTIYENKATNGPSIRVPSNSATLIDYANRLYSGSSITTEAGALTYFNSLNTVICVNRDYEEIVTSGLTMSLDAGFTPSYPKSGSTWTDISFSGNNGTLINGPVYNSSNGGSIIFDATDDRCTVASDGFGIFNNQRYTIDAWVKFTNNSGDIPIFSYDFTSFNNPYYAAHLRHTGTGRVLLAWNYGGNSASLQTSMNTILSGTWYHIVGIVESGRQQIYVNNDLKSSSTQSGTITFYNVPAYVGYYPHAPLIMYGNMAIVRVYNRALSSAEVTTNWNAQKSRYGY